MNFAGTGSVAARRDADAAAITEAARLLKAGGLVAFPTETVYGLGADATNAAAIAKLYAAKGRPSFNPLIAHVADAEAARREGVFSAAAKKLAERVVFLHEGRAIFFGPYSEMEKSKEPIIQEFLELDELKIEA